MLVFCVATNFLLLTILICLLSKSYDKVWYMLGVTDKRRVENLTNNLRLFYQVMEHARDEYLFV
jgi:hypothetical protein